MQPFDDEATTPPSGSTKNGCFPRVSEIIAKVVRIGRYPTYRIPVATVVSEAETSKEGG